LVSARDDTRFPYPLLLTFASPRPASPEDGSRTIVKMSDDGNCLFRAISDQLYYDYGSDHAQVRSEVCDLLEAHEQEYAGFLVLDENEPDEDAKDFASYVSAMRQDGEWGGNLELVVAARLYRYVIRFVISGAD
jgi:OTU-like cysteine protease